jgi:drug/metabolite transporter (DMT)-like permease
VIGAAVGLALAAAVMHAAWNVLLKSSGDPLRTSARAIGYAALVIGPVGAVVWLAAGRPGLPGIAWLMAALSAGAELVYFIFLSEGYRRGELSLVYPLARGTAPLLAVGAGIAILGERPGLVEIGGILLLLSGIWAVRKPGRAGPGTIPALITGVTIATYNTIDKVGTGTRPLLYGWVLTMFMAVLLTFWVWQRDRGMFGPLRRMQPPGAPDDEILSRPQSAIMGLFIIGQYMLVLVALSLAPLVVVAPARESAVVLVTLWGVWKLRERDRAWLRIGGAAGIVAGLALLVVR